MLKDDASKELKYHRILLKYSGEALTGGLKYGIDPEVLYKMASEVALLVSYGVEVGIVLGGGNLFRGEVLAKSGLGRVTGDHMGMLATLMNALAFRDALERIELPARIMSAIPVSGVVDPYNRRKACAHLAQKSVVIFAAGTGNPFFTTDSAACLRAIEVNADIVLKATNVDGVYSADPKKDPNAIKYNNLTYHEVLTKKLKVMDATAICLCQDYNMPLQVFNMLSEDSLKKIVFGEQVGTIIEA